MIPCICFTNLDEFAREQWPNFVACRPIVGDKVESSSGKQLKVCAITHSMSQGKNFPVLRIELHR